ASVTEAGGSIVLEVASDFAAFATMHADEYRDLARKALGRPVKVEVRAGAAATAGPAEGAAPAAPPPGRKKELLDQASREPAVQEALDLFNGKVVDVREP
ncbi:MAG TPA: hypothetical protein VFM29_06965, partial [Vicinamibacteria bacterium]|nr:hypothetical protein [Vicinamibacteria bacterium]